MIAKLSRILTLFPAAPQVLAVGFFTVGFLAAGGVSPAQAILLFLVVLLQSGIASHKRFYSRAVPIEFLDASAKVEMPFSRRLTFLLSVVPLMGIIQPWVGWLGFALCLIWSGKTLYLVAVRILNRKRLQRDNLARIERLNAPIAVHVSGKRGVAYQINQWLPVLERLDQPVVIIVREHGVFLGMENTHLPVLYARNAEHLEVVLEKGAKTVLYPANPMKNVQALRQFRLNHFFINHGESDKAVNQNKLLMAYDKLLVGGPMAERRLREAGLSIRQGQVEHVGRPQAELTLTAATSPQPIKTILYAPTWEGFVGTVDYSSVGPFALRVVEALLAEGGYKLLFKPHPYTGLRDGSRKAALNRIKALCSQGGHEYIEADQSIHQAMNRSDLLLTDVSSVLNEYLVTRKPSILCVPERMGTVSADEFPTSRAAYLLKEGDDVLTLIKSIEDRDSLAEERDLIRKDSLGDFPEGALARFKTVVEGSVS